MITKFRPLLAATIDNDGQLELLRYPMIASPKVDGIRVLIHPELGPVTRSMKPVRNRHVNSLLYDPRFHGFDGEITCGPIAADDVFQRTTSGVMAADGNDDFTYWVFDDYTYSEDPYVERLRRAQERVYEASSTTGMTHVRHLWWRLVKNPTDVLDAEIDWLAHGFEGIMLRSQESKYKFNRSTLNEQILLKLKRFTDADAIIIGFESLQSNQNPQTRSALGLASRSNHKDGKVEVQTLGNLRVTCEGFGEFNVGSGFDQALRDEIWGNRKTYLGKTIKFKYQAVGIKDKPRFPIFTGFRED